MRMFVWCSPFEAAPGGRLHRDADCYSNIGMPAVEQVITVVDVADIDIVGVIPVRRPGFWPRVNETEPIAAVLEAGISAHNQEGQPIDSEPMFRPKVSTESIVRNAVAVVAAALLPSAVVRLPTSRAMPPPRTLLDTLLFRAGLGMLTAPLLLGVLLLLFLLLSMLLLRLGLLGGLGSLRLLSVLLLGLACLAGWLRFVC